MRTDDDSWDITTSVGSTALFVAAARALEAKRPDPLATDQYAEFFCRAAGGQWAAVLEDGGAPDSKLKSDFGRHFISYQGARTKYFDEYFARAAQAGVRQIVLLAAGLDSRAYRLPWPDGTVVYELDQPRVLEFKHEVLANRGDRPRADRREIAVDLRDDWPQALRASGFDDAAPSAWILEGLLIYLPGSARQQLFVSIDEMSAPGSWVGIDDGKPFPQDVLAAKVRTERESATAEPFFGLVYNDEHQPSEQWFGERGWAAQATPLASYLRELGRPIPPDQPDAGPMASMITLVNAIKG